MSYTTYEAMPLDQMLARVQKYHPGDSYKLVEKAYRFAEEAHAGQKRFLSGKKVHAALPVLVRLAAGRAAELPAVASQRRPLANERACAQHRRHIHAFPSRFLFFFNDPMRKL